jgi:carotenoid 1,2-hydratase
VRDGYRWWYIDATSDNGEHGLTIIGFVGSVFSPYYARARRQGIALPENHCAINVALYGKHKRWAMTERGSARVERTADRFKIGPSSLAWDGDNLVIDINEHCSPLPRPLRGRVTFTADALYDAPVQLDLSGKHFWRAVAPHGRVKVEFENPQLSWSGTAYHDMNWGDEPIERGFKHWSWLRASQAGSTHVIYHLERRDGSHFSFGRIFSAGEITERSVPHAHDLQHGLWRMPRRVHSEKAPRLLAALEDAPFYTRNHVALSLDGDPYEAYHESLSLDRWKNPFVQLMLPFRMPRFQ